MIDSFSPGQISLSGSDAFIDLCRFHISSFSWRAVDDEELAATLPPSSSASWEKFSWINHVAQRPCVVDVARSFGACPRCLHLSSDARPPPIEQRPPNAGQSRGPRPGFAIDIPADDRADVSPVITTAVVVVRPFVVVAGVERDQVSIGLISRSHLTSPDAKSSVKTGRCRAGRSSVRRIGGRVWLSLDYIITRATWDAWPGECSP